MIRNAGVPCKVTENLERAALEKLVWNIRLMVWESRGLRAMTRWLTARCRREPAPAPV